MLIQFSVGNFKSIRDEQIFSLLATKLTGHEEDNLIKQNDMTVLKSAVIYGANASGKSNLIEALGYMINYIKKSVQFSIDVNHRLRPIPFLMDESMLEEPSTFEIIFLVNNKPFRYNFSVVKSGVLSEELYFIPRTREALLFSRQRKKFKFGTYFEKEFKDLKEKTNEHALFLTVLAQFNHKVAEDILNTVNKMNVISGIETVPYEAYTANRILKDTNFKTQVVSMLKRADLGIEDIDAEKTKVDEIPDNIPSELREMLSHSTQVFSFHKIKTLNNQYKLGKFSLGSIESEGTKKFFGLAGPILDTLNEGGTLFVDELDAKMHPIMTRYIIQMFNSSVYNPNNAQLIFATHDTQFLSKRFFRRDQIWFVEKNSENASELYALSDFKDDLGNSVRKEQSYEELYLQGKLGSIPHITELDD